MVTSVIEDAPQFPVTFDDPAEADLTWFPDRMHFPRPVSPLFQSVWGPAFVYGFSTAARELSTPILGVRLHWPNGYYFDHYDIAIPADDHEARAMGEKTEAAMRRAIGELMVRWQGEWLPRLQITRARLREIATGAATTSDLAASINEIVAITREDWLIHFRIVFPMMLAMELYDELYAELFGGAESDAHALLVGRPSLSVGAGIGLSELAAQATKAGLREAILAHPAADVLETLDASEPGRELAASIRAYLDEFGLRQDLFDFLQPTWQEDPTIAIAILQSYLRSGHDAQAEHEAAAHRADEAVNAARARLAGYPEQVRAQLDGMVQAARTANFLQEEHNFYIDQQGLSLARLAFLLIGERLAAEGTIAGPDDVFMLTVDELSAVADGAAAFNIRHLIGERWTDLERQHALTLPPFLGAPPAGPPPTDNPIARAVVRFFGGPPQQAESPNQLKGNAGSRGTVRGVARVALTLDDAKALLPGEILVTLTTMPAWTPLFGTAAAVVTETGGPLSHCAIVAREYGIPAVVGAFGATRAIRTGQTIHVDGDRGVVTLE